MYSGKLLKSEAILKRNGYSRFVVILRIMKIWYKGVKSFPRGTIQFLIKYRRHEDALKFCLGLGIKILNVYDEIYFI